MTKVRDRAEMEKRRKKAAKLFAKNVAAPEVARPLGVARQVAYRWKAAWDQGGTTALTRNGAAGPKRRLTSAQMNQVTDAWLVGSAARGYKTDLGTLPRVASLIEELTGVRYHPGHVWRFYFQIHLGSIQGPHGVEVLRHLRRHIPSRMLIIRDAAPIHRGPSAELPPAVHCRCLLHPG